MADRVGTLDDVLANSGVSRQGKSGARSEEAAPALVAEAAAERARRLALAGI
jgi:hypothetical protein